MSHGSGHRGLQEGHRPDLDPREPAQDRGGADPAGGGTAADSRRAASRDESVAVEMITLFREIVQLFCSARVDFIIVGGLAAIAHGSARLTQDVDVVYSRMPDNL